MEVSSICFSQNCDLFKVTPEIDFFASALNHQVPKYISWNLDQEAFAIDAFSISRANTKFYAFPPFSLVKKNFMASFYGWSSIACLKARATLRRQFTFYH